MNWHLCLCSIFQACQFHPTWFCSIAQNLKSGNWLYLYCIWWLCQLPVYLLCYSLYIICLVFQCQACLARLANFPELQRSYILLCLLLCSIFTLPMPNCVIFFCFMFLIGLFLFLVATNCSFVALENTFCICVKVPSLSLSTLYGTIILTWFDDVFRSAVITEPFAI